MSVRECRYRSIRKLETRHVNLKPPSLRSVGFKFQCRVSNFRIDRTSILLPLRIQYIAGMSMYYYHYFNLS